MCTCAQVHVCVLTCMRAALGARLLLPRALEELDWHWSQTGHDLTGKVSQLPGV